jgi:hypothetical protein
MDTNDLVLKRVNKRDGGHERRVGKYNSSELYAIIKGYLKPQDFFKEKEIDKMGAGLITIGLACENKLTEIFQTMNTDCEYQVRKEIKINDEIIIVAKPDFVFKTHILEVKTPLNPQDTIPEKWIYQLEAYYRAFKMPVYLGVIKPQPFWVDEMKYTPNETRWERTVEAVINFHNKLKEYEKKNK